MDLLLKKIGKVMGTGLLVLAVMLTGACSTIVSNKVVSVAREKFSDGAVDPEHFDEYAKKVNVVRDLHYPSKWADNTFDVYMPKSFKGQSVPVVVWVHGGAFVAGDKAWMRNISTMIASEGYAVISMNYQLAPEAKYPVPINQLEELYRHLAVLKHTYPQLDLDSVFLAGDSAGAQIVSQFAAIQTNAGLARDMGKQQIVPRATLKGLLLYCGPFDLAALEQMSDKKMRFLMKQIGYAYFGRNWDGVKQASTVQQVTADYPPAYITDGNTASFAEQGKALVEALKAKGVTVQSRFFDDSPNQSMHEFQMDFSKPEAWLAFEDTIGFLKTHK